MRVCIIVPYAISPGESERIAAGQRPRMDQIELAGRLNAELIDRTALRQSRSILIRLRFLFETQPGLALLAWHRRCDFDLFYIPNETLGIFAAALLKCAERRPRLAVANRNLSKPVKAFLFMAELQNSIDGLICFNEYQANFLERELLVPREKVLRIQNGAQVDGSYFSPQTCGIISQTYLLSVGRENRDYTTLFEACVILTFRQRFFRLARQNAGNIGRTS
jgi:hypothetical protein